MKKINEEISLKAKKIWDEFSYNIKYKNRYFIKNDITTILDNVMRYCGVSPFGDLIVVRARIGDFLEEDRKKMKSPPCEKTFDGRGNPKGISYFYTAMEVETAIAEIRPYAGSIVTVATFKGKKEFNLIDFRLIEINKNKRLSEKKIDDLERAFIKIILDELSKPILEENSIDYIPLQYIIEYLKEKGSDGLIYKSSVIKNGFDIIFFDDDNFEMIQNTLYYIDEVKCIFHEINSEK